LLIWVWVVKERINSELVWAKTAREDKRRKKTNINNLRNQIIDS